MNRSPLDVAHNTGWFKGGRQAVCPRLCANMWGEMHQLSLILCIYGQRQLGIEDQGLDCLVPIGHLTRQPLIVFGDVNSTRYVVG